MNPLPDQKRGHAADRIAVARKARAAHAARPACFTPSEWRLQCQIFIYNNLSRLTRARVMARVAEVAS